jgi:hypothetical protein
LEPGRYLQDLPIEELNRRYVEFWMACADDLPLFASMHEELDDLSAEYNMRESKPPDDLVKRPNAFSMP